MAVLELELGETVRRVADPSLAHEAPGDIRNTGGPLFVRIPSRIQSGAPPEFLERVEFEGRPLIGAASLLNRETELAQLQAPARMPVVAEEPAEPVEVASQAPAVEVAVQPVESPAPAAASSEERHEFVRAEPIPAEAGANREASVPPENAAGSGIDFCRVRRSPAHRVSRLGGGRACACR
jgi:hypothetical protein